MLRITKSSLTVIYDWFFTTMAAKCLKRIFNQKNQTQNVVDDLYYRADLVDTVLHLPLLCLTLYGQLYKVRMQNYFVPHH